MQDRSHDASFSYEPDDPITLDRARCLDLLGTVSIGRVIYTDSALPAAHPVTYLLDDEEIVFRTSGGGKLAAAARNAVVGFEVDEIDQATRTGWAVLGIGTAYEVVEPRRLAGIRDRIPQPWATDRTDHIIAIPLQRLTGRLVIASRAPRDDPW